MTSGLAHVAPAMTVAFLALLVEAEGACRLCSPLPPCAVGGRRGLAPGHHSRHRCAFSGSPLGVRFRAKIGSSTSIADVMQTRWRRVEMPSGLRRA
jgi:hypothetical protein